MKGLKTLIKLQKGKLDELRQGMTRLEEQRQLQEELIHYLQRQLEDEEQQAMDNAHLSQFFGDYSKRIKSQQDGARDIIRDLNRQISKLQLQIAAAFGELKKLEITEANIKAREAEAAAKREQEMLDEVALQQFARKQHAD